MKSLIVLSSLLYPADFQQWINRGEIINPSHQQYMARLVQALQLHHEVTVLSFPPQTKTSKKLWFTHTLHRQKNLRYLQFSYPHHRWLKPIILAIKTSRFIRYQLRHHRSESLYLIIDGNNRLASLLGKKWQHHPRIKVIGVITDDPRQLSQIKKPHIKQWRKLHRFHDAYIGLTVPLLDFVNPKKQPQLLIPGLVEVHDSPRSHPRPYFFFSGALYERYGIEAMIQGFLDLKQKEIDLLIAGFGPEASLVERLSQAHRQIKYLGLLTPKEASRYQAAAVANLNPRPVDPELDAVAIPSKVLDYLSAGVPTITTEHPFIKNLFNDYCHWIQESSPLGIRVALNRFIQGDYHLHSQKALQAQKLAFAYFGVAKVAEDLKVFINSLQ